MPNSRQNASAFSLLTSRLASTSDLFPTSNLARSSGETWSLSWVIQRSESDSKLLALVISETRMTPLAFRKYAGRRTRAKHSYPAVSQICALTFPCSVSNSMPMVAEMSWFIGRSGLASLATRDVFPTPESPSITILYRGDLAPVDVARDDIVGGGLEGDNERCAAAFVFVVQCK